MTVAFVTHALLGDGVQARGRRAPAPGPGGPRPDGSPAPDGPVIQSVEDKLELIATDEPVAIAAVPPHLARFRPDITAIPLHGVGAEPRGAGDPRGRPRPPPGGLPRGRQGAGHQFAGSPGVVGGSGWSGGWMT
ncbi:hypothetical protein [Nonomuraea sp. GTA35]|uniref:hypothetical protein n=1 Tax=Nonomuraea sp. GTA35 TaxID=1676746 RepID=UPI0035C0D8DE